MYTTLIAIILILVLVLFICIIYNIVCAIQLFLFIKHSALKLDSIKNIVNNTNPKLNIWLKSALHRMKKLSTSILKRSPIVVATKAIKRASRWCLAVSSIEFILIALGIIASIVMYQMNIVTESAVLSVERMSRANTACICYAKCTGDEEDDRKCTYELIFGPSAYETFTNHMALTPEEKEKFVDITDMANTDSMGVTGRDLGKFIIEHLEDTMVNDYKQAIGSNGKFISDGLDRTQMTNEELKADLINLLNDYKVKGRNPDCSSCFSANSASLTKKCIGAEHWEKGWEWSEIDSPDSGNPKYDIGDLMNWIKNGGDGNAGNPLGQATGKYSIQLDDGSYYWYHQTNNPLCVYNPADDTYGTYGKLLLGASSKTGSADIAKVRGCGSYATAMAVSNILGIEATPYIILKDVLHADFGVTADGGYYAIADGTRGLKYTTEDVSMDKKKLAKSLEETFGSLGLKAIAIKMTQSEVDEVLAKGGVVVTSFNPSFTWYTGKNSHFILIRKKADDGLYYCLNSTGSNRFLGSDIDLAIKKLMNTGIEWSELSSHVKHSDGLAVWKDGSANPSGQTGVFKVEDKTSGFSYIMYRPTNIGSNTNVPITFFLADDTEANDLDSIYNLQLFEQLKTNSYSPYCIIVAPCLENGSWTSNTTTLKTFMDTIINEQKANMSRVYLTGVGTGAEGAGKLINENPAYFKAFAVVAGKFISNSGTSASDLAGKLGTAKVKIKVLVDDKGGRGSVDSDVDLTTFESTIKSSGGGYEKSLSGCTHDTIQQMAYSPTGGNIIGWLLAQDNSNGSGIIVSGDVYSKLKASSTFAAKAETLAYVYDLIEPTYGSDAAIGIMANIFCEGKPGLVQYGKSVPNWDGDGKASRESKPSNGLFVRTHANINAVEALGNNKNNKTGVGMIQWTYYTYMSPLANKYRQFCTTEPFSDSDLLKAELDLLMEFAKSNESGLKGDYKAVCTYWLLKVENPAGASSKIDERCGYADDLYNTLK